MHFCKSVYRQKYNLYLHHTHCLVLQRLIIPSTFRGEYPRAHFCSSGGTLPRLQFPGLHRYLYLTDLLEWVKRIWSVTPVKVLMVNMQIKHCQLLLFKCLKLFFPLWWRHWNVSGFCVVVAITDPRSPKRAVTVSSPSWHILTSNSSVIHSSFFISLPARRSLENFTEKNTFEPSHSSSPEASLAKQNFSVLRRSWQQTHNKRSNPAAVLITQGYKTGCCFCFSCPLVLQIF